MYCILSLVFCVCQWEENFEFGTFVCACILSLAFLSGVDESWERFSGFLSILWLPKQEQYEINVLRMISCRLLLPIHRVIFEENINQKKMCNSCLTVSK